MKRLAVSFPYLLATILVVVSTNPISTNIISSGDISVSIGTSVAPDRITVGDPFLYQIIVKSPGDAAVEWPESGVLPADFELVSFEHVGPILGPNGTNIDSLHYELTLYRTGEHSIPPFSISCILSDGTELSAVSDSATITVISVLDDNADDIRDLKSPVEIPGNILWYWWVIGLLVLLSVTVIVVFLIGGRRGRKVASVPEVVSEHSPEEIILKELEQLIRKDWLTQGLVKVHYSELSEILRRYLSDRYQIAAMEYTTTELIDSLNVLKLEHENIRLVRVLFEECDMVKFAKFIPESHRQKLSIQEAREIVEITRPRAPKEVSVSTESPTEDKSLTPSQDS